MKTCILCQQPTNGSVGAAGLKWDRICQPCKDKEDQALSQQLRAMSAALALETVSGKKSKKWAAETCERERFSGNRMFSLTLSAPSPKAETASPEGSTREDERPPEKGVTGTSALAASPSDVHPPTGDSGYLGAPPQDSRESNAGSDVSGGEDFDLDATCDGCGGIGDCYCDDESTEWRRVDALRSHVKNLRTAFEKAERELVEAWVDLDRIRGVPFERGPDGEPNGPDLGAFLDVEKERDQLRRENEQLKRELDSTYGIALGYKREADSLREEKLIRAALDSGGGEKKPEHRPDDESCPCKTCSNALIREQLAGTFNRR